MPRLARPAIGTMVRTMCQSPLPHQRGSRRHCTLPRDTEPCRLARRGRRDSRVTSQHGENVSFGRVTACHTRLEPKAVLRGTRIRQVEQPCAKSGHVTHYPASPPPLPFDATSLAMTICASSSSSRRPVNHEECRHWPLIDRPVPFSSCDRSRNLLFAGSLKKLSSVCASGAASH